MQYQKIQTVISFYPFWTENPAIVLDNRDYGEIKKVFLNLSNINERSFCENSSLLNPNKTGIFEGSFFWGRGVHLNPAPLFIFQEELI